MVDTSGTTTTRALSRARRSTWRIQKRVWARGLEQVGVFHSHRRHPANFSLIDYRLHMRNCEGLWHMIV